MTTWTIRIDQPFQATLTGDHDNHWQVTDHGTLSEDEVVMLEFELLPSFALGGRKPGGLPDHARYPVGVLSILDGEVVDIDPPYESVAGRIY